MRLRKPYTTATIWSSGKVTCAGAKSEPDAYKAARRYCRLLQKMQFKVKLMNYRVVNVLATCAMPFSIDVIKLSNKYQKECSYEPELHPGATFKIKDLRTTLKLFTTGSITLTAPTVDVAQKAITYIFPIVKEFRRSGGGSDLNNPNKLTIKTELNSHIINNAEQTQTQPNASIPSLNTEFNKPLVNDCAIKNEPVSFIPSNDNLTTPHFLYETLNNSHNSFSHLSQSHSSSIHHHHNSYFNSSNQTHLQILSHQSIPSTTSSLSSTSISNSSPSAYSQHTPSNLNSSHWYYDNPISIDHVDDFLP